MITYLSGTVIMIEDRSVVIETNGIGYRVWVPLSTLGSACVHENITLWTSFVVREQSQDLYGFEQQQEVVLFEKILGVSGVGPKSALALFDTLPPQQFIQALLQRDAAAIARTPGIGKKGAEKIILDLADKVEKLGFSTHSPTESLDYVAHSDIEDALLSLGYSHTQVRSVLPQLDKNAELATQIKQALSLLS